jgi:protease PrsW
MQPDGPPPLPRALPPPLPPPIAKPAGATKWLLATAGILAAIVMGLLTLLLLGTSTGAVGLVFGIVLAVLPLPIYMLLALWIDRFEKEPVWMLVAAFLWGATVSVFFAFILNTAFGVAAAGVIGAHADMATSVISAPFVEELAKGFALFIFYRWKRDEFDNVLDGIIYAAMVGLGFAMTENILYYGNALATGGLGASIVTFILRGVVSPFAHPLFTSMTGIGLGLAQQARRGSPIKFFGPLVGLGMAMFLHFLWNFSASFGAMFFVAYVVIMVPAFLGLITLIAISLRKEGQIIREHLLPELRNGLLPEVEYQALCTVGGRMRGACRSGGWAQRKTRLRLQDLATELAFHRWRTSRGIFPRNETPATREAGYLAQLHAIAAQLGWTPAAASIGAAAGSWTLPPLPTAVMPATAPTKVTRAPRTGGFSGAAIAVSSIGCLGLVAVGVIGLGVLLYAAGDPGEAEAPVVVPSDEALEAEALATLLPPNFGDVRLQEVTELDADTLTMLGAVNGAAGEYSFKMGLLLLRYRSPELAATATEPLRAAMFPERAGWRVVEHRAVGDPARRFETLNETRREMASVWNYGSLVIIFSGDTARMPQFAKPREVLTRATR